MKILFVEDNLTYANSVKDAFVSGLVQIEHVISKDQAINSLQTNFYDLILLDLTIPASAESLDKAPEHGQDVFYAALGLAPSTPVYFLTASQPDSFTISLLSHSQKLDLWGCGTLYQTVDYKTKDRADLLIEKISEIAGQVSVTNSIPIETRGVELELSPEYQRALKSFTRKHNASSCHIWRLNGGLSEAYVLKATIKDGNGRAIGHSVVKLGSSKEINIERQAYERHVKLLKNGCYPTKMFDIEYGLKDKSAIFYNLAEGFESTFFDIASSEKLSTTAIAHIRKSLGRWEEAKTLTRTTVREVRRRVLSDSDLVVLLGKYDLAEIVSIEAQEISIEASCIHGDLHGGNILVDIDGTTTLIDFGDVGMGFACLDPITLELSLLFHPDAVRKGISKQLETVIDHWPNLSSYTEKSPFKAAISECRGWAYDVGGSDKAILAAGYAFVIRQLKYPTVNPEITLRFLNTIYQAFLKK